MLDPDTVAAIPQAIMTPFRTFFDDILAHVEGLVHGALGDALQYLLSVGDNTDTFGFSGSKGFVDSLPVSFNCIALKPGVTLNLSAFLVRTEQQALDAWRLETFDRLNQAYYQLLADYDARRQMAGQQPVRRGSPGLMRGEERDVIKSRVIRALRHKYGSSTGTAPTLDELRLFEHAIDWENVSFRLFTYGPSGLEVAYEKLGFFDSADERRKRFLNAAWAQVLIPLRDDGRLEQVLIRYLETGTVDFEADLLTAIEEAGGEPLNELTEIYRDLVLQREQLPEIEPERREETIPTELMVIYEPTDGEFYPVNPDGCRPPQG